MNENNDLRFNILFDSAFNLLQSVDNSKKYSDKVMKDITQENIDFQENNKVFNDCNSSLQELIGKVEDTIIENIEDRSHVIANNIVHSIYEEFNQANQYANEASEIYKKASNKIIYKVVLLSFITFFILTVSTYFGYTYFLQEKHNELITEIRQLEINKQNLVKLGASFDVKLDQKGHAYVRVDMSEEAKTAIGESKAEFMLAK